MPNRCVPNMRLTALLSGVRAVPDYYSMTSPDGCRVLGALRKHLERGTTASGTYFLPLHL
jgi:hypothetical protein